VVPGLNPLAPLAAPTLFSLTPDVVGSLNYQAIIDVLGFATGNERPVRITTTDGHVLIGVPTSLDAGRGATEIFLQPVDDPENEISLAIGRIQAVSLL